MVLLLKFDLDSWWVFSASPYDYAITSSRFPYECWCRWKFFDQISLQNSPKEINNKCINRVMQYFVFFTPIRPFLKYILYRVFAVKMRRMEWDDFWRLNTVWNLLNSILPWRLALTISCKICTPWNLYYVVDWTVHCSRLMIQLYL